MRCGRLNALILAGALVAGLSGGCVFDGGTSSGAENPGLTVGFRVDGEPAAFHGYAYVYASGKNPDFHVPPPLDEADWSSPIRPPEIYVGTRPTNLYWPMEFDTPQAIDGDFLSKAADFQVSIPILPPGMSGNEFKSNIVAAPGVDTLDPARPFNLVFRAYDGATAFVQGIAIDSLRKQYRGPDGNLLDTLWVDLSRPRRLEVVVDTAGLSDTPLIVFTPGSPYVSRLHGNRFEFENLPSAVLPVRLVTASGAVLAFTEALDATGDSASNYSDLRPMIVGEQLGSVELPPPLPMLTPPAASPPGPLKFTDSLKVVLAAEPGSTIYFSRGATEPGPGSEEYTGPIVIRENCMLKAVAYRKGVNHSVITMNSYTLVPKAPSASPASRAFRDTLTVTLSADAGNATILYTTDGTDPVAGSAVYSGPIRLDGTTVLKAVTSVPGLEYSHILNERYILVPDTLAAP